MARRPPPRIPGPPAVVEPNPTDPVIPDPQPITAGELADMKPEQKLAVGAAAIAQIVNHAGEGLRDERLAGYAAAEAAGRPWTDIIVVFAHNQSYEPFFKDHAKLSDEERAYMIELLSIEDTVKHAELTGVAKLEFERDWATARWRWKRHAEKFFPGNKPGWSAKWMYRSDLEDDPIYEDTKHPWSLLWHDAADIAKEGTVQFLVIAGGVAQLQPCVIPPEEGDLVVEVPDAVLGEIPTAATAAAEPAAE